MDLYFSPLACSLATRIALYEAGADAGFIEVDPKTKRIVADGSDYLKSSARHGAGDPHRRRRACSPRTPRSCSMSPTASPTPNLAPRGGIERARLHQWLCFVGTELHKGLFMPLFDQKAPEGTAANALAKAESRLAWLNDHLTGREFLLDRSALRTPISTRC